jgi:hypothetical protein
MDQPLPTIPVAADPAASDATAQTARFGGARATLRSLGPARLLVLAGHAILAPADQALRPRVTLAEKGLPRGGSVRDDIFDQQSAPGTANFLVNINLRRALGGEPAPAMAPAGGRPRSAPDQPRVMRG